MMRQIIFTASLEERKEKQGGVQKGDTECAVSDTGAGALNKPLQKAPNKWPETVTVFASGARSLRIPACFCSRLLPGRHRRRTGISSGLRLELGPAAHTFVLAGWSAWNNWSARRLDAGCLSEDTAGPEQWPRIHEQRDSEA